VNRLPEANDDSENCAKTFWKTCDFRVVQTFSSAILRFSLPVFYEDIILFQQIDLRNLCARCKRASVVCTDEPAVNCLLSTAGLAAAPHQSSLTLFSPIPSIRYLFA
jgi:hypothetical protein